MRDKCGITGVISRDGAANCSSYNAFTMLQHIQHRGHDGVGIASFDEITNDYYIKKEKGTIKRAFKGFDNGAFKAILPGSAAIAHNKYTTSGDKDYFHPIKINTRNGDIYFAYNGNISNYKELVYIYKNSINITTDNDLELFGEIIKHIFDLHHNDSIHGNLLRVQRLVKGGYSCILLIKDSIYILRDIYGIRPLHIAKNKSMLVVASETCAIKNIPCIRILSACLPGEISALSAKDGYVVYRGANNKSSSRPCMFENIYFSKPESKMHTQHSMHKSIYSFRKDIGHMLAEKYGQSIHADYVMPVPDSSIPYAIGYAEKSSAKLGYGIKKNSFAQRTFIARHSMRASSIQNKYKIIKDYIFGQSIIIIDDSIVRLNTMKAIIREIKLCKPTSIVVISASPPVKFSCHYGIATPDEKELIAHNHTVSEIEDMLGINKLIYFDKSDLRKVMGVSGDSNYCDACISGDYFC